MTLRMDDMNQKENAMKLSMQTLEYRMLMLEDLSVLNIDILNQIRQTLSQFEVRSRNISSSSRGSSRMRLDSEDSGNDQVDIQQYEDQLATTSQSDSMLAQKRRREFSQGTESEKSLTPEVSATMRPMPSPILIHSHKALREDSLQKYTDFSKASPKPSTSSLRRLEKQSSVKNRRSLPKVLETSPEMENQASNSSNSLLERRQGHALKLQIDTVETSASSTQDSQTQVHRDANIDANNCSVYSTAHMDTATSVSSHQPAQIEMNSEPRTTTSSDHRQPLNIDIATPELNPAPNYQETSDYSSSMYTVPFTPILTSRSAEYTTITDEIDTSCMMTRSPPRSPTSAVPFSGEMAWEEGKSENPASRFEKAALKQAEEMEHRKMEKVIRKRLRQISMDEGDSISDIARLVITEMETEDAHSDHEDDEDMQGSTENIPSIIKEECEEDQPNSAESGPITFEAAVEIRIRRASTLIEEDPHTTHC